MIKNIKKYFKQLFCLHIYRAEKKHISTLVDKIVNTCTKCGKQYYYYY